MSTYFGRPSSGCQTLGLNPRWHDLTQDFARFGIHVQIGSPTRNSDDVIFCVSITNGVSSATQNAIANCSGKDFRPLCIVLTNSLLMGGDSLTGMAEYEERELISTNIGTERALKLSVFQDLDPNLVTRVVNSINNWSTFTSI
ncbi:hypothetical protein N9B54_03385 [Mariniblastus sp.]|nr:hypothetical protein [Mariniblastus sp.]